MTLWENCGFRDCSYVELRVVLMGNNSRIGMNHFNDVEGNNHNT